MMRFDEVGRRTGALLGEPPEEALQRQRGRFLDEVLRTAAANGFRPRPRVPAWLVFAAAASCALAVIGIWALAPWPERISDGAAGTDVAPRADGQWLEGGPNGRTVLLTKAVEVTLSSGARARAQRVDSSSPLVTIEGGDVDVEIDPGTGQRWSFLAGAYRIDVLGTIFHVGFEPASGDIAVRVQRGRVRVSGGQLSGEAITLAAGQRFEADGTAIIKPEHDELPDKPPASPVPRPPSWADHYGAGKYVEALAAAESEGFEDLVARSGPGQLANLADAARFAGSTTRARQALLALRDRFPSTPAAGNAAFLLGRMEGSPKWFETYLGERPNGSYAPEAAGRLMVAYRDNGDAARARTAAETYLANYPGGPYADLARSLLVARDSIKR